MPWSQGGKLVKCHRLNDFWKFWLARQSCCEVQIICRYLKKKRKETTHIQLDQWHQKTDPMKRVDQLASILGRTTIKLQGPFNLRCAECSSEMRASALISGVSVFLLLRGVALSVFAGVDVLRRACMGVAATPLQSDQTPLSQWGNWTLLQFTVCSPCKKNTTKNGTTILRAFSRNHSQSWWLGASKTPLLMIGILVEKWQNEKKNYQKLPKN